MIRVLFLIRSLDAGGAERQLCDLVKRMDKQKFDVYVVTFYDGGKFKQEIESIKEIHLISLGKKKRWDLLSLFWRFFIIVRKIQPQILHGYQDMPNILCILVGKIFGIKVIWGIRSSFVNLNEYYWTDKWLFKLSTIFSKFPDLIITNSFAGKAYYQKAGYAFQKMIVINNGIDTEKFYPSKKIGRSLRVKWGIQNNHILIGLVGRLDPIKDHPTFIKAAGIVTTQIPNAYFACVGNGNDSYQTKLIKLVKDLGLKEKFIWAGYYETMVAVYNAFDILCLTSYGEGFPNAIGEAMACGIPVVTTDVGDAAEIVGNSGKVVQVGDSQQLAEEIIKTSKLSKPNLNYISTKGLERITKNYSLDMMVEKTEEALSSMLIT